MVCIYQYWEILQHCLLHLMVPLVPRTKGLRLVTIHYSYSGLADCCTLWNMGQRRATYTSKFKLQVVRYTEENVNREVGSWTSLKKRAALDFNERCPSKKSQNQEALCRKKQVSRTGKAFLKYMCKTRADRFFYLVEMLLFKDAK